MDYNKINALRERQTTMARMAGVPPGTECYVFIVGVGHAIVLAVVEGQIWRVMTNGPEPGWVHRKLWDGRGNQIVGVAQYRVQWGRGMAASKSVDRKRRETERQNKADEQNRRQEEKKQRLEKKRRDAETAIKTRPLQKLRRKLERAEERIRTWDKTIGKPDWQFTRADWAASGKLIGARDVIAKEVRDEASRLRAEEELARRPEREAHEAYLAWRRTRMIALTATWDPFSLPSREPKAVTEASLKQEYEKWKASQRIP